jgi:protein-tyrosine kinase
MSRIDEALARAQHAKTHDLSADTAPLAGLNIDYPVEAGEELAAPEATPASVPRVAEPAAVPSEPAPAVVDALGDITQLPAAEKLVLNFGDSVPVEQYRRLAARLLMAQTEKKVSVVMVTSAFPEEGKTLTATNLALTLSESYKRKVLLIDADLRRPWIHQVFQVPNVSGLNDGLRAAPDRKIPLLSYTENLSILTAGRPDADPMSVLSGERMVSVLEEAQARFEWVIIDTPPVALLTDAHLLSSLVHAVVLIIQAGKTPLPAIKMAVDAVGRDRVLGVVLNRAESGTADAALNYYSSYRATEQ